MDYMDINNRFGSHGEEDANFPSMPWENTERSARKARELYNDGRCAEALNSLEDAISSNPCSSSLLFNKGLVLDALTRFDKAIEAFQQADDLEPDDLEILCSIAVDYSRICKYDSALRIFEELQRTAPDFEPGYCNRIVTYANMGKHDKAEEMFYLAREIKDECPLCYYNMGNSLFVREIYDKAVSCWEKTRSIEPTHPEINYWLGQAYWKQGKKDEAKECFVAEIRGNKDKKVISSYGLLLLEMSELEYAEGVLRLGLDIEPNAYAQHYLGELRFHRGDIEGAIEWFKKVLDISPKMRGTNYRLGQCYQKLGRIDDAQTHLRKEITICPSNPDLQMELGSSLYDAGLIDEASLLFHRALDLFPKDPRISHNLSCCYYFNNRLEDGIVCSLKVLEIDPAHLPSLRNLIYANLYAGELEKAGKYMAKALRHWPNDSKIRDLRRKVRIANIQSRFVKPNPKQAAERMKKIMKLERSNVMWYPFYELVGGIIGKTADNKFFPPLLVRKPDWRTY